MGGMMHLINKLSPPIGRNWKSENCENLIKEDTSISCKPKAITSILIEPKVTKGANGFSPEDFEETESYQPVSRAMKNTDISNWRERYNQLANDITDFESSNVPESSGKSLELSKNGKKAIENWRERYSQLTNKIDELEKKKEISSVGTSEQR